MTPEERLTVLEAQQADVYEALKLILQGRWTGEMPHAEAFVKAIRDDEANQWNAVPFPKA